MMLLRDRKCGGLWTADDDEGGSRPPSRPVEPLRLPEALALRATSQWGVFTREQALEHGLTGVQLDRRLRRGDLTVLRRGVYATDVPDAADDPCGHHLLAAVAR